MSKILMLSKFAGDGETVLPNGKYVRYLGKEFSYIKNKTMYKYELKDETEITKK